MKKAIIIIVTVLVVLAGACTCLYFFTDVFNFLKPANTNFALQAKKLLGKEEATKYSEYEEMLNNLKKDKSYISEGDLSLNLSVPNDIISYSAQQKINLSKIKYNGSYDADSKATSASIKLSKDNEEFTTVQLVKRDNKIGIASKDLYDKTLVFDLSKYDEFCTNNNIEEDEDTKKTVEFLNTALTTDNTNLAYDLFYLSEDDFNSLSKTYGDLLTDLIPEEKYSTEKNQKITVNGDDVKTTEYSLTLNSEDLYNILTKFLELAKEDDTTKKIIVDKYNVLVKYIETYYVSSNTELSDLTSEDNFMPELTSENIEENIDELLEKLEQNKEEFTKLDKCVKFTIYSNKKSEPVKFEIICLEDEEDEDGTVMFSEALSEEKTTYTISIENLKELFLNTTSKSTTSTTSKVSEILNSLSEIIIEDKYEKTDNSKKGTITISAKVSDSKEDLLKIEYDKVNSDSEYKNNFNITCPLYSEISIDCKCELTGLDTDNKNMKLELNGEFESYSVKLSATGSIKYGESDVSEFTNDNSVSVFELSQEEYNKLITDIGTTASENLPEKFALYDVDVTKEDILSLLPQTSNSQATEPATEPSTTEVPTTGTELPAA